MSTLTDVLFWVVGAGIVCLTCLLWATHRHDRAERLALEGTHTTVSELHRACADDLALLAADVRRHAPLDDLGQLTDVAWGQAHASEIQAQEKLAAAETPADFEAVTGQLARSRQALAEVQALVLDDEAPAARPCCFFNPNHGPSDAHAVFTTANGTFTLPCCAADARRIESGADPYARTWPQADQRVPWWQAGESARPWARGWFGAWRHTEVYRQLQGAAPVLAEADDRAQAA